MLMMNAGWIRVVGIFTIISFLIGSNFISPVLASESLRTIPTKGDIGDEIEIRGHGYDPGDSVYIYFSDRKASIGVDIDDLGVWEEVAKTRAGEEDTSDEGEIESSFEVPEELNDGVEIKPVNAGQYWVYSTTAKEGKIRTVNGFVVRGISLVYPEQGVVDTEVMIRGNGFLSYKEIKLFFDGGNEVEIAGGLSETDSNGDFVVSFFIPPCIRGVHSIYIRIGDDERIATFNVISGVEMSASSGVAGELVGIGGTGFAQEANVILTFDEQGVGSVRTDKKGSFTTEFTIPRLAPGTYKVEAEDANGNAAYTQFNLSTGILVTPLLNQTMPGHVGMEVTITGTGFKPDTEIAVVYVSTATTYSAMSESNGSFSMVFEIPESQSGEQAITVSDGLNSVEAVIFVESEAPPAPQTLLPESGSEPELPLVFDWKDVSDPSGVTYNLQVARDKSFNDILLERKQLTESGYTLPAEIELRQNQDGAPYWWRVMAVDRASNQGEWSDAQPFYVGSTPIIPEWMKYVLGTLVGILLIFLAFFLYRRIRKTA